MASVYKRASDRARGKAGKWTCCYLGADGRKKQAAGVTDKAESLRIAQRLESEARMVREGLADPAEKARREAGFRAVADHVEDYRRDLLAKGDTAKHAGHVAGVLRRVLADAEIEVVGDLSVGRVRAALGRMIDRKLSARTCNHALGAVKAFATWLLHEGRVKELPQGLAGMPPYNEKADRRRIRRALSKPELDRLLAAAEQGGPVVAAYGRTKSRHHAVTISGPERAALYRLAMGTGFRADELRTLTPERFALEGAEPTVTVLACYSKNGKEAVQPITRELADSFRPFLEGKEHGKPVLAVPGRTAEMLRADLAAAGIEYRTGEGVLDFHALRGSYITHLIKSGANPRVVQLLARHSTVTLTLERYTKMQESDLREALDKEQG